MTTSTSEERASERLYAARARGNLRRVGLSSESIQRFLREVVDDDLHVRTILSLSNAVLGVLHSASLCIHMIGRAYGWVTDHDGKHGVKQVDPLLSNAKVLPWALARAWIAMLVGPREEMLVALDWTDFDKDDHTTLVASLITNYGRATPMVWKTVKKSKLAEQRNAHEDELGNESPGFAGGFVTAVSEGINSAIQTIKKRAFGFRHPDNFKTAIYFHCGGLDLYPAPKATHAIPG
jgi:hypothetical protein